MPDRLLSPNLHIAVCRFLTQELERGPLAGDTEYWLERAMNTAKPSRRALHAEKTMVKTTQTFDRALQQARVLHGCRTATEARQANTAARVSSTADPAAASKQGIFFKFAGVPFNGHEGTMPAGCSDLRVCMLQLALVARAAGEQLDSWRPLRMAAATELEEMGVEDLRAALLKSVDVWTFKELQHTHFPVCAPAKGTTGKVEANTWVEATVTGPRGGTSQHLWHVQSFVLLQLKGSEEAVPLRLAFIEQSDAWERRDLCGLVCYKAPSTAVTKVMLEQVAGMSSACTLVRAGSGEGSELRLVPMRRRRLK